MPRTCAICSCPDQEAVRAAFATNATDRQLAQLFGVSHMAIGRHRRNHLVAPLKAAVAALDRGRAIRERRQQQLAAIEQGASAAIAAAFALPDQLDKVARVEQRLERLATSAEQAGSPTGVAALAAQQLRSVEVGSRLAAVGGYKPPSVMAPSAEKATITIEMVFPNSGKREEIALAGRPVLDGDLVEPPAPDTQLPNPVPLQKFQGDISGYWDPSPARKGTGKDDSDPEG
jgi:hypothetical protein